MTQLNTDAIITACDSLAHKVITIGGKYHGSVFLFDQCMRAFDNKRLPAQAITFAVYFNAPVMKEGEATIYRDGRLEMKTI